MVVPLNTCTTIEQRGVVRFLWEKNMEAKDPQGIAAHMGSISLWIPCGFVTYLLNRPHRYSIA
jgi:hypothetical protein